MRLFKKPKADLTMAEISTRMRGFLLDSQINNAHEISMILGCAAESDELMRKKRKRAKSV